MSTQTEMVEVTGDWLYGPDDAKPATFPARLTGRYWNGWAVPLFDRATAERYVEKQMALRAASDDGDGGLDSLTWDGDVIVVVPSRASASPAEQVEWTERIEPDGEGLYGIGGCSWCWYVWEGDDDQ